MINAPEESAITMRNNGNPDCPEVNWCLWSSINYPQWPSVDTSESYIGNQQAKSPILLFSCRIYNRTLVNQMKDQRSSEILGVSQALKPPLEESTEAKMQSYRIYLYLMTLSQGQTIDVDTQNAVSCWHWLNNQKWKFGLCNLLSDSNTNVNSAFNRGVSLFYWYCLEAPHNMVCPLLCKVSV